MKNLRKYYITDILAAERITGHRLKNFCEDKKKFFEKFLEKISQKLNWR